MNCATIVVKKRSNRAEQDISSYGYFFLKGELSGVGESMYSLESTRGCFVYKVAIAVWWHEAIIRPF